MDEETNKKIEELKKNPPSRMIPLVLLFLAIPAVFFYRVATTDPKWESTEPAPAPQGAPAAKSAPKAAAAPRTAPSAKPAAATKVAPTVSAPTTQAPEKPAATVKQTVATADETGKPTETPTVSESKPTATETRPAATEDSVDTEALEAYLNGHLGQKVPFLYKGEKRTVTLAAFSDDTVTIKRKKSFTMKRSDLSAEQLKLWR